MLKFVKSLLCIAKYCNILILWSSI